MSVATPIAEVVAPAAPQLPKMLGFEQVAERLDVCVRTIERMHKDGRMPAPRKLGRALRWHPDELAAWLSRPKPNGELMTAREWAQVWAALVRQAALSRN